MLRVFLVSLFLVMTFPVVADANCSSLEGTKTILNQAKQLGQEMGVWRPGQDLDVRAAGCVPVEINGVPVPDTLLTLQQREAVSMAQRLEQLMDGQSTEGDALGGYPKSRVFESRPIDPNAF